MGRGYLFASVAVLGWSLTGIFVRLLDGFPPTVIVAGRLLVALLVFVLYQLSVGRFAQSIRSAVRQPVGLLFAALLCTYYLCSTTAFQHIPVAEAALILGTSPLFVFALRLARGTPPNAKELAGAVIALAGMAIVLCPSMSGFATDAPDGRAIGDGAALGAAFVLALYAFLYSDFHARGRAPHPDSVIVTTFVIGAVAMMLLFAPPQLPRALSDGSNALNFVLIGIVSTALPTIGVTIASQRLPSVVSATINIPTPVLAGCFAYVLLGEDVSPFFIPGAAFVLGGVVLIVLGAEPAKARADAIPGHEWKR